MGGGRAPPLVLHTITLKGHTTPAGALREEKEKAVAPEDADVVGALGSANVAGARREGGYRNYLTI